MMNKETRKLKLLLTINVSALFLVVASTIGCSAHKSTQPIASVRDSFSLKSSELQAISERSNLYGVDLILTNDSSEPREFWTSSCNTFLNWWIDNHAVLPVKEESQDCVEKPRAVNLQPHSSYTEFVTFYIDQKNAKNNDFHIGFSPWESKLQLQKRALKMLPADQIKDLTVWSNRVVIQ